MRSIRCRSAAWLACLGVSVASGRAAEQVTAQQSADDFRQIATVLRHPRCMNCHTVTDFPRQGDDRHPHIMDVKRGPDDHGAVAARCSSCHQAMNQVNGVPGAPKWALAPLTMGWEHLNDHQLAEAIKDPEHNGHRTLAQIQAHMAHDELVAWAWHPGPGRDAPAITQAELGRLVQEWIDGGAVSPPGN